MAVLYGISDIGANKSDPTEVTNPKVYCSGRSTSYHKLADTSNVVINSKPRSGLIRNIHFEERLPVELHVLCEWYLRLLQKVQSV